MQSYKNLLTKVLAMGEPKPSRAGMTIFLPHQQLSHDCRNGFPALTGRKLHFKSVAAELDCFIHGISDIRAFHDRGCHIWDANLADYNKRLGRLSKLGGVDNTDLGFIYGRVWRGPYDDSADQLAWVLAEAKRDPSSRRLFVTAWVHELAVDPMTCALPPCHLSFQLTINNGMLDLCFYMRSVDLALGLPFDMASYALLQALIANDLGLRPRYLTGFLADAHIYEQNRDAVTEYLGRELFALPTLVLDLPPGRAIEAFDYSQASLDHYQHGAAIKTSMAV
jgi:thymidylate synthase